MIRIWCKSYSSNLNYLEEFPKRIKIFFKLDLIAVHTQKYNLLGQHKVKERLNDDFPSEQKAHQSKWPCERTDLIICVGVVAQVIWIQTVTLAQEEYGITSRCPGHFHCVPTPPVNTCVPQNLAVMTKTNVYFLLIGNSIQRSPKAVLKFPQNSIESIIKMFSLPENATFS